MTGQAYVSLEDLLGLRHLHRVWMDSPKVMSKSLFAGIKRSKLLGRGLDFEELRHYQQGDDVNSIDWRVSQRVGQPHVRVYSEERDHATVVLLDQTMSMFFGSQRNTKSVTAAKLASFIGWHTLRQSDRFGLHVFSGEDHIYLKPSRLMSACLRAQQAIASFNQSLNATKISNYMTGHLAKQLRSMLQTLNADQSIVIVSDLSDWNDECLALMQALRRHHRVCLMFVFDPLERNPRMAEGSLMGDHQQQVLLSKEMLSHLQWWSDKQDILASLNSIGIATLDVSSADDELVLLEKWVQISGS